MTRFALERFLYRLSRSPHADAFVLKGAALFVVWAGSDARPTRDVDLLARVEADLATVSRTVAAICRTEVEPDGLNFQPEAMQVEAIQALRQFGGFRVIVPVLLGRTRLQVQIDLGFGDAVTPAPQHLTYPTLLDFPAPQLAAYHMETVIAEKLEAMINLGTLNIDVSGIPDKETLHEYLSKALGFPDYYGRNWDAFWDCICSDEQSLMPTVLEVRGIVDLRSIVPHEAQKFEACLNDYVPRLNDKRQVVFVGIQSPQQTPPKGG